MQGPLCGRNVVGFSRPAFATSLSWWNDAGEDFSQPGFSRFVRATSSQKS
jgi:hypothetical protein